MGSQKKSGYALKKQRGLVPHHYDKGSESFKAGAWKHWPTHLIPHSGDGRADTDWKASRRAELCANKAPEWQGRFHRFVSGRAA